jgi:hypothetical protein
MKLTLVLLIAILSARSLYAQKPQVTQSAALGVRNYPDSIRVEFPDQHGLMIFQLQNFQKNPDQFRNYLLLINQVADIIEKNSSSINDPKQIDVSVSPEGERKITIRNPETGITQITASEKEITQLLPPGWEIHVHLARSAEIYFYAQTFAELKAMISYNADPLKQLLSSESQKIYQGRKRFIARIIVQKGEITFSSVKFQMPADQLEISGSCGIGYLNRTFYPELNLLVSFRFGDRVNTIKNAYSLIWNNLFFATKTADGKFNNRTNSFLSVAYGRNFGTIKESTWLTFGAGYLILKNGDYFTGKTAKFFFSTNAGKFTLTPELYLTNDFKTFQTGIKLGYKF